MHLDELRLRARRAAGAGAAVARESHRADGVHRHGGGRQPGPERGRRPGAPRPRHPAAPGADDRARSSTRSSRTPTDPLRLVFVCAMWMTGFDAPSVSTVYLDRPMRNHTLMQTIARANRVFPEKENGLIVDYIGVFRDLEQALAIYGAANAESGVDSPIQDKARARRRARARRSRRSSTCASATTSTSTSCASRRVSSSSALRDAAVEALLVDDDVRTEFLGRGPAGPQAVQGGSSGPGRRGPSVDGRGDPGACRTRSLDVRASGYRRSSAASPMPSTRCSTVPSVPRST